MLRILTLIFLVIFADIALASELKGTVCLGENLAKPASEHSERLYLKIGNLPNIHFVRPYRGPKIVARNLDIRESHIVKVYFGNKVVKSWALNFSKLKTNSVLIWRATGSWRMEPNNASSCK